MTFGPVHRSHRVFATESSHDIVNRALGRDHPALQGNALSDMLDSVTFHGLTETKAVETKPRALAQFDLRNNASMRITIGDLKHQREHTSKTNGPYVNAATGSMTLSHSYLSFLKK